ncbi:MAG TPA: YidC/Oxa1 family membrane protein insertase [Candidatus Paceibacterota bacterium]|nr:YidC/Oxa1 family membrane protein insertase [Candidatus Paceibacterota bacterium]
MISLFNTVLFEPLHNALAFLVAIIPGGDIGLAIIILTIIVKLILYPLTKRSIDSNRKMKLLEPELAKIKEEYKDKKEEQAKKTFELYKQNKINPFAGCLIILIQLPIIIALYYVFLKGLDFSSESLYSFVTAPTIIKTQFLGLVDMGSKSLILAILAGITQYLQTALSMPKTKKEAKKDDSFSGSLKRSMDLQMRYFLPLFIGFVAFQVQAAVALYWVTSNIFTIGQELYARPWKISKEQLKS